ncbi:N-acetylmuramoyl-L-alanine amidase family protein, partial [Candidatus Hakubella thermalkaliphila]
MILATDGGNDPGAVGPTGLQEKVVCLNVALRVRALLAGRVDVRLSREADVDTPFSGRLPATGAACFISIHCNAHASREANGTE